MPIRSSAVGAAAAPHRETLDARWLMAYAAGLGVADDQYFDTTRPNGVVAHPVFPVCPEWGLLTGPAGSIDYGLDAGESFRGVHAAHDLVLHRPIRQGDEVVITATVVGVEAIRPGARVTLRIDGHDPHGAPMWTTWYVIIYRGVQVAGVSIAPLERPDMPRPPSPGRPSRRRVVEIPGGAAHVYTECARIWNPIHTDVAVARAAGLPGPILHGTATLAHGVSAVLDMTGIAPDRVARLGGDFRAMVPMPSVLSAEILATDDSAGSRIVHFQVTTPAGEPAVGNGFVESRG